MKIVYFKADIGNFGDDLNGWIWEKIFGDLSKYQDIDVFGIGSILDKRVINDRKKVVFGSGIRDVLFDYGEVKDLNIEFVRGPISSKITNNSTFISDGAYALRMLPREKQVKEYKLSIVPYFRHANEFDWMLFEKLTGIHVILPTIPVEDVIKEINKSEKILAAAMHGAILADIYRVPWARVKFAQHGHESALTSELKWADWLLSIDVAKPPVHIFDFTFNRKTSFIKQLYYMLVMKFKFKRNKFITSSDNKIKEIDKKIENKIEVFKEKYLI